MCRLKCAGLVAAPFTFQVISVIVFSISGFGSGSPLDSVMHICYNDNMEVRSKIWLSIDGYPVFGSGREALLRAIENLGSINKAAKDINISYRKALSYIQSMEQRLGKKLVIRQTGGLNGGGAALTKEAREFLGKYEQLEEGVNEMLDRKFEEVFGNGGN